MSLSPRRAFFAVAMWATVPVLAGCPKKTPTIVDAGLPEPVVDASPEPPLLPMEPEDAGVDAGVDAGPPKYTGPAVNVNVARLKQCCNAIAKEAQRLGASPEAGMLTAAAAQCNVLAAQAGPTGNAPELAPVRGLLAGRQLPAACSGL